MPGTAHTPPGLGTTNWRFTVQHIGYLIGGKTAVCVSCFETRRGELGETAEHRASWPAGCRLYDVNVAPYRQTCASCGAVMLAGASDAWPELFDGALPQNAAHILKRVTATSRVVWTPEDGWLS
jgi:hypothetical protein